MTGVSKISGDSLRSSKSAAREAVFVAACLCLLAACAVLWCFHRGYILYYGDAQAHLNLSRNVIDSRTPGSDSLGTVWLPLLHILSLPLVANDWLWSTGLAGSIPAALCFVVAGTCFYLAARDAYGSPLAAAVVVSCFALNPNVLYLASIPMTEIVFSAGLALFLFALLRFRITQSNRLLALGIVASVAMSLTRYDGWFLIPFAASAFAFFARAHRWRTLFIFGSLASLAPLYWFAHNWWVIGSALDFYKGPYSAAAIQGARTYPGDHNWLLAAAYYAKAGQLCAGWPLLLLGVAGIVCAVKKRASVPALFLLLIPIFYVWSIHSGVTPVFVPQLEPHSYYNCRYGIAVVVLAAFAAGAIVLVLPARWKRWAIILPLLSIAPWVLRPSQENWICWKESQVNSELRRAWTLPAAQFLSTHYRSGEGILIASASGDVAGILCQARIPFRESINVYNGPAWFANTRRPDLVHQALWAVARPGDPVSKAISRDAARTYQLREEIQVGRAPAMRIYRRIDVKTNE